MPLDGQQIIEQIFFFLGRGGGVILLAINCHLVKEKFNILAVKFLCFPIFLYRTLIDIGF